MVMGCGDGDGAFFICLPIPWESNLISMWISLSKNVREFEGAMIKNGSGFFPSAIYLFLIFKMSNLKVQAINDKRRVVKWATIDDSMHYDVGWRVRVIKKWIGYSERRWKWKCERASEREKAEEEAIPTTHVWFLLSNRVRLLLSFEAKFQNAIYSNSI